MSPFIVKYPIPGTLRFVSVCCVRCRRSSSRPHPPRCGLCAFPPFLTGIPCPPPACIAVRGVGRLSALPCPADWCFWADVCAQPNNTMRGATGPANALLPNGKDGQKQPKGTKGKPAKLPRAHKVAVKQEPGDLAGHTGPAIVPALLQGAALPLYMGVGQPGLASDGATHWQNLDGTSAPAQQLPSLPFQFGIGGQHQLSSLSAFASQDQASQLVSSLTGMGGGSYFGPVQTNVQPAISSLLPFGPRPTVVGQLFDPAAVIPTSTAGPSYSQLYEGEVELELSTLFPGLGPTGGVATSNIDASMAGASAYPGVMGGTGTAINTRINSLAGFSMMTHSAARPV